MAASVMRATELVSCPPLSAGGLAQEIRSRGNIPVTVGASCMVELTPAEVAENWASARAIRKPVVVAMIAEISQRLCVQLASDEPEQEDIAGEAAACLFLSLHHRNVGLHEALEGCRVVWDEGKRREQVEYLT